MRDYRSHGFCLQGRAKVEYLSFSGMRCAVLHMCNGGCSDACANAPWLAHAVKALT